MNSSEKILMLISNFIETGILTSQDAKKQLINNLKFKRDDLIDKLQLVSREEYNILKKIIEKQQKQINQLKKKKNYKGKEILICKPLYLPSLNSMLPPCDLTISSATRDIGRSLSAHQIGRGTSTTAVSVYSKCIPACVVHSTTSWDSMLTLQQMVLIQKTI